MKIVGKVERSYKQTYKKKTSTADPYLPKGASKNITVCEGCHTVYKNKRWYDDTASLQRGAHDSRYGCRGLPRLSEDPR